MKALPFALAATLLLSACATDQVIKVIPVAGGRTERITFTMNGPEQPKDDNMTILLAAVLPSKATEKFAHSFSIKPLSQKKWVKVVVKEITQDPEYVVLEDNNPSFNKNGLWIGMSEPLTASSPRIEWVHHESVTTLMYRVKITFEDGSFSELPVASIIPFPIKIMLKKDLGL